MRRRDFCKLVGLVPLLTAVPGMLQAKSRLRSRTLLLVELHGGNDGLNTVVPHNDPLYKNLRPRLGISRDQVLPLSDNLGLNPVLEPLMPLWRDKELGIALGVGYKNPNRSHFRSVEIWDTASDSDVYLQSGWLAQALAGHRLSGSFIADGIVLGRNSAPLIGANMHTIVMRNIGQFLKQAKRLQAVQQESGNPALTHLLSVRQDVRDAAAKMRARLNTKKVEVGDFPKHRFGKDLKEAARLILNRAGAPVIKVAIGGFDTHRNQRGTHDRLLKQLAEGIAAFRTSMQRAGVWNDVLVMTYSEFGRRVGENGSLGTDHGTAAPHFMIGGRVKGGFYGKQPSLYHLQDGDLKHHVDYRQMYNTAIGDWWGLTDRTISGRRYHSIRCLRV